MRKISYLLLLLLVPLCLSAQERMISGVVTDSADKPLVGATIVAAGSTSGATTGSDGTFTLKIPSGCEAIIVTYIGYNEKRIPLGTQTRFDVKLEEAAYDLNDVVVVGYGSMKRSDLTGSLATVNASAIVNRGGTTVNEAMQGRLAGVQIISNDGAPGSAVSMKIRGGTSINSSNAPLYVVDGMLIDGDGISFDDAGSVTRIQNPLADLNSNDIESIEVLKDASATAIYGSRGANGVVLITTKQGSVGKTTISYTGNYGVQRIPKTLPVLNTGQFIDLMADIGLLDPTSYYENTPNPPSTNFQKEIYRTGQSTEHQISISGGKPELRYFASLGYLRNDGIVINSMYRRYSGRFNMSGKLNRWLKFSTNNSVSNIGEQGLFQAKDATNAGAVTRSLLMRPDKFVRQENADTGEEVYEDAVNNPVLLAMDTHDYTDSWNIMSSSFLEASLVKGLSLKVSLGVRSTQSNRELYYPQTVSQGQTYKGLAINTFKNIVNILNENTLNYTYSHGRHSVNAVAGMTVQQNQSKSWTFRTTQFASDDLGSDALQMGANPLIPNNSRYVYSLMSYLARVNYNYAQRYLFTVSIRADGSSRFADGHKWGYFPSAAFAWRASEEEFIRRLEFFDQLKLRVSWGITGNQNIPNYSSQNMYNISSGYTFDGDSYASSVIPSSRVGNPDLTWEHTAQYNAGLDISILNNRLQLTVDAYYKKTTDMLFYTVLPPSSGVSSVIRNYGAIENKGLEFSLNGVLISRKDFTWNADANIAFNRNKVLSLGDNKYVYVDPTWNAGVVNEAILMVGQPVGLWWGYKVDGVFQYNDPRLEYYSLQPNVTTAPTNTSGPGDYVYREMERNGEIDDADKMVIGRSQPLFTGGFSTGFTWKNLSLNMQFAFSYGNDIFNANRASTELMSVLQNQSARTLNRWRAPETDSSGAVIPGTGNPSNTMAAAGRVPVNAIISPWIEDGSYLRLQSLVLSYTLPEKWMRKIGCSNARIYLSGQNIFVLTGYSGYDPDVNTGQGGTGEIAPGLDYGAYPKARTFSVGLNLSF